MSTLLSESGRINLLQPQRVTFGIGCGYDCIEYMVTSGCQKVLVIGSASFMANAPGLPEKIQSTFPETIIKSGIPAEPTVTDLETLLEDLKKQELDTVVAMGGGSVLDVAKLVAVLHGSTTSVSSIFGRNNISGRTINLICLPTTSGSGSEVSPNAILYDPATESKQAAISPFLIPDAAFVDPSFTVSLPASLTAATGFDALCHCIEAFTNKHAHPIVDRYAEEGIRLLASNIRQGVQDGADIDARSALALGSLYGGLCLGPVNTAGVHALSYPLGSAYRLSHGLSNALLLAAVMEFNLPSSLTKHARIARLMGVGGLSNDEETARAGIQKIRELMLECGLPEGISALGIATGNIPALAEAAMKVERLLNNNPRPIHREDAEHIYHQSY